MKEYVHRSKYGPVSIPCYNTNDLLSDTQPLWSWNRHFGSWDAYFSPEMPYLRKTHYHKTRRWRILWMLRLIINEFFTLLMEDLILHNDVYRFPAKLGTMQISYLHPGSCIYQYQVERQGKTYRPVFAFTREAYQKVKVQYYCQFTRRWNRMLREEYKKGHTYELITYEHILFHPTSGV